ncbi:MAG: cupredoxin domain-containing protein [Acidimicrobiales bacterium]
MRARIFAVAAVVAVVAVGCGGGSKKTSSGSGGTASTAAAGGGANQVTVEVDGHPGAYVGDFLAYFPNEVTVTPGDTVSFRENWTGEPHTVTMGTLVEKGLAAARAAGPDRNGPPPADFASLPVLLPEGPGDANQNAAQPCFLETGAPPKDGATPCPKTAQTPTAFNGRQTYYNSGFLPENATFSVKLAPDIAPGTYHYYCNLHGPQMSGTIVVTPKGTAVPSAAEVAAAGKAQLDALVGQVAPAVAAAKGGHAVFPGYLAGYGKQGVQAASVNEFIPSTIKAKVGQKVTWTVIGPHTISFGAPDAAKGSVIKAPDGTFHLNQQMAAPAGGPGAPPPSGAPSGPPPAGPPVPKVLINGGTYDGTGFHSSGLILSFPGSPQFSSYSLTFTKAGTYTYVCLIHPGMAGQVQVG